MVWENINWPGELLVVRMVRVAWEGIVNRVLTVFDNCIVTVTSLTASGLLRIGILTFRSVSPGWKVIVLLTEA